MVAAQQISQTVGTGIPTGEKHLFKNILLTTDFSPASKKALEYPASLARRYGSSLYLTHVITVDGYPLASPEYAVSSLQNMHDRARQGFRDLLKSGQVIVVPFKRLLQG